MAARGQGKSYQGMNYVWGPTREAIYFRDRDPGTGHIRCLWCGLPVFHFEEGPRRVCLDHLLPVSLGGTHSPRNLITSCFECNRLRGACDYEAWIDSANWNPEVDFRIRPIMNRDLSAEERAEGRARWQKRRRGTKTRGSIPSSLWSH